MTDKETGNKEIQDSQNGLSTGQIASIVVGIIAVILVILLGITITYNKSFLF